MTLKPYRQTLMHMLDRRRAEEKILVHLHGDASRLLSINRGCILASTVEQVSSAISSLESGTVIPGSEVVGLMNRFAVPGPSGYRDLKALIKDGESGFISTMRVVLVDYEESTFRDTAPHLWAVRSMQAAAMLREAGAPPVAVIVADNYLREDDHSLTAVYGFESVDSARAYAVSRFKDGLRVLADQAASTTDLKYSWLVLGEDVAILVGDEFEFLSPDLMAYIVELSVPNLPYWDIEASEDLMKAALPVHPPEKVGELP